LVRAEQEEHADDKGEHGDRDQDLHGGANGIRRCLPAFG
jgi:hypothetical protein